MKDLVVVISEYKCYIKSFDGVEFGCGSEIDYFDDTIYNRYSYYQLLKDLFHSLHDQISPTGKYSDSALIYYIEKCCDINVIMEYD